MEISLVAFVLILLLCLIMSGLIGSMIYYLLYRKLKSSENMSSTPATTISNIESAPVIPASQAFSSGANEQTSSTIAELENGLDTDGAPGAVFTITRTPFGTRTTAAFDLSASLRGSWTAAIQVSLATALEGVLTLHRHLQVLRLKQSEGLTGHSPGGCAGFA